MLKVVKVLHLSQLHTHKQNSEWYEQQVKMKLQNLQNIHVLQTDGWKV